MIGKAGIQGKMKKISDCSQKGPFSRQAIHCLCCDLTLPLSFTPHPAVCHPVRQPAVSSVYPAPTGENAGDKEKKLYYNEENQSSDVTGKDEKQMRTVQVSEITENIKEMCIEANHTLTEDMEQALNHAVTKEQAALGKQVLGQLQENLRIAREDTIPICQGYRNGSGFYGNRPGCPFRRRGA